MRRGCLSFFQVKRSPFVLVPLPATLIYAIKAAPVSSALNSAVEATWLVVWFGWNKGEHCVLEEEEHLNPIHFCWGFFTDDLTDASSSFGCAGKVFVSTPSQLRLIFSSDYSGLSCWSSSQWPLTHLRVVHKLQYTRNENVCEQKPVPSFSPRVDHQFTQNFTVWVTTTSCY